VLISLKRNVSNGVYELSTVSGSSMYVIRAKHVALVFRFRYWILRPAFLRSFCFLFIFANAFLVPDCFVTFVFAYARVFLPRISESSILEIPFRTPVGQRAFNIRYSPEFVPISPADEWIRRAINPYSRNVFHP